MKGFIEVTGKNEEGKILVNIRAIDSVYTYNGVTRILPINKPSFDVEETYDEVKTKIECVN